MHVPEPPSAPSLGAGEGTGANLDDGIHNNRILRQPGNELTEDDDLPTQSVKGEGNGKPGQGSDMDSVVSNAEVFRDSGHVIAALSDAPASQVQPNDIDVTNSGQGEEFRASTHLSIKGKSYAGCLRNNEHSFPGPEAEQATAPTGVANADSGPRSEAAGKELSSDAHDSDQSDVYAQGNGEDACESDSYDEYEYDECDFDDQGSGDAEAESCDDEAEAYDVYDSDDYDDDLDPLHDGCESEIDDFEFSDSECGE